MRLFVGIPASEALRANVMRVRDHLPARLPLRWLDGTDLHITLLPPWEAPDPIAASTALSAAAAPPRFTLFFGQIEPAPERAPRLIWARAETPSAMLALRDALAAALDRPIERRPLRAHLTLARFRPEAYARLPADAVQHPIRWRMEAREAVLFESRLGPGGARYEPLARLTLR